MNVAIIGAGRTVNGIGPYIAKYFHKHDMPVVAVLGRGAQSSVAAASTLAQHGIKATAYSSFTQMIAQAKPGAVVIASPTNTHAAYIEQCLAAGVHIFCDKPFVSPDTPDLTAFLVRVLRSAHASGQKIAMNSQWPFVLKFYEELCGPVAPEDARMFAIRLSPVTSGTAMIADSVPHALSILYCALGNGEILDLKVKREGVEMLITFDYQTDRTRCGVTITLVQEHRQPRTFAFGFDGRIAKRMINLDTYAMTFEYSGRNLPIPDPMELSVKDFIDSLSGVQAPRIGPDHIARTTMLLKQIYDAAINVEGTVWKN